MKLILTSGLMLSSLAALTGEPCRIEVVEKGSGWPVPLVELRTTHNVRLVTDNAGVIAFDLPELMGRDTWFDVVSQGYERPKDGFGYRGVRLKPEPGKTLRVEVNRTIIARRLGRLTGGGLFAESQKTGRDLDWRESGLLGCDSVQTPCIAGSCSGPGRHDDAKLSAGHLRHEQRDDFRAATRVLRAAAPLEVRLLHRYQWQAARRGQDARQRSHLGQWLRQPPRQERCAAARRHLCEDQAAHGRL